MTTPTETTQDQQPVSSVPSKCTGPTGAGIEPNPCMVRTALPRCVLCPASPNYWRDQPAAPRPKHVPITQADPTQWGNVLTAADGWTRTGADRPCVTCGRPAMMRSPAGVPQHKVCAEVGTD